MNSEDNIYIGKTIVWKPVENRTGFFRNPAMGWVLYIDAFGDDAFPEAGEFWGVMDKYIHYASILYIRVPWSQLEPEEGKYAWIYDANYKKLVSIALDKGVKLAFRVYVDGRDGYCQSTPQFVKDGGCEGYITNPGNGEYNTFWTPYLYDSVFQKKFSAFISAFAREYDNPDIVDYIDAQGLGWWGEMHNVEYMSEEQRSDVFYWITGLYSGNFTRALLGDQYGKNSFAYDLHDSLLERGWVIRRDSFGSPTWFTPEDKEKILENWPKTPVFAENCYHHLSSRPDWWGGDGFPTVRACLRRVIEDAKECHANTLDLRVAEDAEVWSTENSDLVEDFAVNCGYRLVIKELSYPEMVKSGSEFEIKHVWKNTGIGKLPNNCMNWNYKYRPAFAILDAAGEQIVYKCADREIDPGEWVKGIDYSYKSCIIAENVPSGTYQLAVAIVDTSREDIPSIHLAIEGEVLKDGWYKAGNINICG